MNQKELAALQVAGLPAYFKGGAALYEDLKTTNRFLRTLIFRLETRGNSRKQNNKRLEYAAPPNMFLYPEMQAREGQINRKLLLCISMFLLQYCQIRRSGVFTLGT